MENEKTVSAQENAEPTVANEQPKEEKKTRKASKTAELEAKLDAVQKELEAARDQYQRMLAEYANYKRRTEQEKLQIGLFTKGEILAELLTSVDNMEKALASEGGENYKAGVDLVMRQFMDTLGTLGLEKIEALNAPFDPNVHNAVMREDADGVEPETVTAVFQEGYKLGERVLRPAMVKVAN